jgi:hypothetical protein
MSHLVRSYNRKQQRYGHGTQNIPHGYQNRRSEVLSEPSPDASIDDTQENRPHPYPDLFPNMYPEPPKSWGVDDNLKAVSNIFKIRILKTCGLRNELSLAVF